MAETKTPEAAAEQALSPYLFKDCLDAFLYVVVYFALPLCSVLGSIELGNQSVLFTALSCSICLLYDCYTRYDKESGPSKKRKIYLIGSLNAFLTVYTFVNIYLYINVGHFFFIGIYVALAIPPIIGLTDALEMIADDIDAKG